ncbi:MAG: helix-turn-helix domain-containing protein [Pseudomonadota bacterium]
MRLQNFEIGSTDAFTAMGSKFRQQILQDLVEPASASALAKRHDMSRQRIGYHMRDLEKAGCISMVGERAQRGLTEKLYQVTPRVFTQAPSTLPESTNQSEFSFTRLVNVLGHALTTLARIKQRASAKQTIATLALDATMHFENPSQRKAFTEELLDAVQTVIRKHEQARTSSTRSFRVMLGAYPDLSDLDAGKGTQEE